MIPIVRKQSQGFLLLLDEQYYALIYALDALNINFLNWQISQLCNYWIIILYYTFESFLNGY